MKKVIIAVIGSILMLAAKSHAYDDGDFQVWHTENQEFKLNDKFKITTEEEFRWGDDASQFFYQHYDAGLVYSLNKNLDLGMNYRQVYELRSGNKFREENRPHINATVKYELYGFKLDDRNRLEYRHFDWQEDAWRYRNKFGLRSPWKFTKFEIQPYVSDEMFVSFSGINQFDENRFSPGVAFSLTKNIKGEIYYMLRAKKSTDTWVKSNILGTKLKLVF